jgi:C1A family cysteine protease
LKPEAQILISAISMDVYGWKVDRKVKTSQSGGVIDLIAKDWDAQSLLSKLKPIILTYNIDLSSYGTDTDQLSLGSCAGNAVADAIEILDTIKEEGNALTEGRPVNPVKQLSRLFVHNLTRESNGQLGYDDGASIRSCFDTIQKFGICEESAWPYDTRKVFVSPSLQAQRQALGHKIGGFYRIKSSDSARLDEIVLALRAKHPVVFGTLVNSSFRATNGPFTIDKPGETTIGGHAMIVVGYIDGMFKVKNSWGPSWRDHGYCFMTPSYLSWVETQDLWVPTLGTV